MQVVSRTNRWLGLAVLLAWSLSHAAVFGDEQPGSESSADKLTKALERSMATSAEKIKIALDQKMVLDYTGQTLQEGLQHLTEKTKVKVEIDQTTLMNMGILVPENMVPTPVALKSDGKGKVRQALQRMLSPYNLSYVILDDTVLITTEEMGLYRQMRQRVNVEVKDQPLNTALKDLARRSALNLIIDPRVAKDAQAPVSLEMEDATLETAVRLLAELGNLKSVRMGNVLFVTSESRADKIRKEDLQTNPLTDPRFSSPDGPRVVPGVGGGIGVAPAGATPALPPVPDKGTPPPNPDSVPGQPAPPAPPSTPAPRAVPDAAAPPPLPLRNE